MSGSSLRSGSGIAQLIRGARPRNSGQDSSAHSVITRSTDAGSMVSTCLLRSGEGSIPSSANAAMANGFTRDGALPADCTRTASPNWRRARASAIWLRAELATQRNSTLSNGIRDLTAQRRAA